jgi:hypothetical protein
MGSYRWQPVCLSAWFSRTNILAPAVVGVRADAVDRDDAVGEVSMKLGTARADVLHDLGCVCWRVAEHL